MVFMLAGALTLGGVYCPRNTPLDAIPDLTDVQVIVFSQWEGRGPSLVEDQITYPIVTKLISAPNVRTVRGYSFFGYSFVYVIFKDGTTCLVRGRGYIQSLDDLRLVVVGADARGTPVLLKDVARNVAFGPEMRRGAGDFNGEGETTGGIVMVRFGQNVLRVIDRIKAKLEEIKPSLPEGVEIVTTYDRAYQKAGRMKTQHDLFEAITCGAVQRVRPKLMTVSMITLGLVPALWAHGAGAEAIQRIAAPMIAGLITSSILTLEIVPAIYSLWRGRQVEWVKGPRPPRKPWAELNEQFRRDETKVTSGVDHGPQPGT